MIAGNARAYGCIVLLLCVGCAGAQTPPPASQPQNAQGSAPPTAAVEPEQQRVRARFEDPRYLEMLRRTCFAAAQAGEKGSDELVRALFVGLQGSGQFDFDASVARAGGIEQYKARIASYLTSDDVMARGTAALALAIAGDLKFVEPLVGLLRSKNLPVHAESLEGYDRGMAMMALAVLEASEYRAEIEAFATSELQNESAGAQAALELMER